MKRIFISAALIASMLLLSGCGKESAAVSTIGGADGPTAVIVAVSD